MIGLFLVLTGTSVVLSLAFIAAIWPDRHRDRGMFWFLVALAAAGAAVDAFLFVALAGTQLSPWWLAAALVVQDAVFGWRLWLALKSRLHERFAIRDSRKE